MKESPQSPVGRLQFVGYQALRDPADAGTRHKRHLPSDRRHRVLVNRSSTAAAAQQQFNQPSPEERARPVAEVEIGGPAGGEQWTGLPGTGNRDRNGRFGAETAGTRSVRDRCKAGHSVGRRSQKVTFQSSSSGDHCRQKTPAGRRKRVLNKWPRPSTGGSSRGRTSVPACSAWQNVSTSR